MHRITTDLLGLAAEQGYWEVVQLLLEKGADVSLRTTKGETVLHKAFLAKDEVHVTDLQLLFVSNKVTCGLCP
jgi:ankyrin repeat protein